MDHFELRNGELFAEDVPLARIAGEVGTPSMSIRARRWNGTRACSAKRWHA